MSGAQGLSSGRGPVRFSFPAYLPYIKGHDGDSPKGKVITNIKIYPGKKLSRLASRTLLLTQHCSFTHPSLVMHALTGIEPIEMTYQIWVPPFTQLDGLPKNAVKILLYRPLNKQEI
jgi:hypothetical protein